MQLGGQAVEAFAGRFQVEYRDGENWLKYGNPLSLDGSGEIYLDLPVYRNGKTESAEATVYRVVESVPEAYTSKTYNVGDGAYYQTFDPDARQVVSREFTLEEAREQGKPAPVQTINITNIPRSNIALTKYNAGYGASGDDRKSWITSEKAGAAAAETIWSEAGRPMRTEISCSPIWTSGPTTEARLNTTGMRCPSPEPGWRSLIQNTPAALRTGCRP